MALPLLLFVRECRSLFAEGWREGGGVWRGWWGWRGEGMVGVGVGAARAAD